MDTKFDVNAANRLLMHMDQYCTNIVEDTRGLLKILNSQTDWKDAQTKVFQVNVLSIAKDLENILALESEYMRTFDQRIKELVR